METISAAVVLGTLGTILTTIIVSSKWSSKTKQFVAIGVYVGLTLLAVLADVFPTERDIVLSHLLVVVGAGQLVYSLLKPTGLFSVLGSTSENILTTMFKKSSDADEQ